MNGKILAAIIAAIALALTIAHVSYHNGKAELQETIYQEGYLLGATQTIHCVQDLSFTYCNEWRRPGTPTPRWDGGA